MKKFKYALICIVALGILGAILRPKNNENKSNEEERKETSLNQFSNYLSEVNKNINQLSDERKAGREKYISELKQNPVYVKLVDEKVVSTEYLPLLNAISSSLPTITDKTFGIIEDAAKNVESSTNGEDKMDFVVKATALAMPMNGGLPKEIVEVFNSYKKKYKIYGEDGVMFDDNKNRTEVNKFDLTPFFVMVDPTNEDYLNQLYEAKKKGLSSWIGSGDEYIYPYLTNKNDYIAYVKKVNPNNPYVPKVDLEINAIDLFEAYEANEVAADELYKDKKVLIEGVVGSIGKDITNAPYVSLEIGYLKSVNCYFSDENNKELSKLIKGDRVQIIGKCGGLSLTSVIIKKCELWE